MTLRFPPVVAVVLLLAGCKTPPDPQIVPFTAEQSRAFFARARPPQVFGLTVYQSDAGPIFAGSYRAHEGDLVTLPFLGEGLAPVIEVTRRASKPIAALLDTCSRETWVTAAAGLELGVVPLSGPNPFAITAAHVYDEIGGYASMVQKLMFDTLHVENAVVHVRAANGPLGPLDRWVKDPEPAMVLGTTFVRAFSFVRIDFATRNILLSASGPARLPPEGLLVAAVPMRDIGGAFAVEGMIDGEPQTILIDIAGDYELTLGDTEKTAVRRLSLGDLVFPPDLTVANPMELGLGPIQYPRVGRRLLSKFNITLDTRGKRLLFERPLPTAP